MRPGPLRPGPLRIVFMGTPDFALPALAALHAAGHEIISVYTQPPRPAGRGRQERRSPVHDWALAHASAVRTPQSLKDPAEQVAFASLGAEVAVVAAYGLILPKPILAAPRLGCLNIHASLLPRWRGAAPIQRAILAGDNETGITIMQMDEGLDTGPILLQSRLAIGPRETASGLQHRLAELGGRLIVEALDGLAGVALSARAQPAEGMSYAPRLTRADGRIDWRRSAGEIERRLRAFDPWPGAWFELPGATATERVAVLAAEIVPAPIGARPGEMVADGFTVACGSGALALLRVRGAGRAALSGVEYLRGARLIPGTVLA